MQPVCTAGLCRDNSNPIAEYSRREEGKVEVEQLSFSIDSIEISRSSNILVIFIWIFLVDRNVLGVLLIYSIYMDGKIRERIIMKAVRVSHCATTFESINYARWNDGAID